LLVQNEVWRLAVTLTPGAVGEYGVTHLAAMLALDPAMRPGVRRAAARRGSKTGLR